MCGIAGIVLKKKPHRNVTEALCAMSKSLAHRGPDGEGFMAASKEAGVPYFDKTNRYPSEKYLNYLPQQDLQNASAESFLFFAHRRLSIIDLSETGHQPMCNADGNLWITYNGEIYNYIELREELKTLGCRFISESDTEVILHAYHRWGRACVERFNGMWAFCIYDKIKNICFASRDRLGVKPFYYIHNSELFSFASEQKAFVKSGLIEGEMRPKALHAYLMAGLLENESSNFFEEVMELFPGHNLIYQLHAKELTVEKYFDVHSVLNLSNDNLSPAELINKIEHALEMAVALRLRSDVEVAACLSGGIDSSVIATLIPEIIHRAPVCFTAVFPGEKINEEYYADLVSKQIRSRHVKVSPTVEGFMKEINQLVYALDAPIWNTSTYAQFKVMELAKLNGIKVVLDGQGADELFAGYHHHFMARWNNLLMSGKYLETWKDFSDSQKSISNPALFFVKQTFKSRMPYGLQVDFLLKKNFISSFEIPDATARFNDVNLELIHDISVSRLKTFLRCEDRCGMWHSVESRVPFSDDMELIKLMFSFNGNKKIQNGISKYLLREASKKMLPKEIYARYDKKGFETPMQDWLEKIWNDMLTEIREANFDFVINENLRKANSKNTRHSNFIFKLYILALWRKQFGQTISPLL